MGEMEGDSNNPQKPILSLKNDPSRLNTKANLAMGGNKIVIKLVH